MPVRQFQLRARHLVKSLWTVALVAGDGTEYSLGEHPIEDSVTIPIPITVPDGEYDVRVITDGVAWRGLIQKTVGSILIARTDSVPVIAGLPLFKNLRYDIHNEWLRIKWNGDVPPELSGLVSAGLWFSVGAPDFASSEPTVTIPLFSQHTEHVYIVNRNLAFDATYAYRFWTQLYWAAGYWRPGYWHRTRDRAYVGVAPINSAGERGAGQYIPIPDRSVVIPSRAVKEG